MDPRAQQKKRSKTDPIFFKTTKMKNNVQNTTPESAYEMGLSLGWRVLGTFGGPIRFLALRMGPQRYQSASNHRTLH